MRYHPKIALAAMATLLAFPIRSIAAAATKPALTLQAPVIPEMPRALIGATIRADVSGDTKAMIAALQTAHNEFKATVEANVGAKADGAEVTAKLDAINATMSALEASINEHSTKLAASQFGGDAAHPLADAEYTNLFSSYMREGSREQEESLKAAHRTGPRAAMTEGTNADGGYTTPIEWDRTITGRLKLINPIRAEATVQSISTAGFTKLFTDRQLGSGWVGETAARPATSTPQFTALGFGTGELYANAAASQTLLDDSEINIEQWLVGEIETEFARQEGIAFLSGDGTNKPFGLLGYVTGGAAAARHPWGAIEAVNSGAAAAFTTDGLVDTVYKLPATYEPNAKFYMNRSSLGAVRKLKDGNGNFIWQPTFVAGQPSTLLGRPVVDVPDMPNLAAGALAALFGDMRETYLVIERIGVRVLRDPYTNKPFICFYVTKRVGGGVKNPDSMKAIKIGAA
ncbi:phage major capsid protein, HK97 family [Sphingomonas sp. LH128]|uniref:phage major capsid protein n=1 Tax=Sphingomonas sp. LH128 TaxID=473781 RepID=UPI00027CA6DA|nr:phage major capsid protein [Sphingomonas sp. LH128]EJU13991.1 phage major capsid protein, HK97 family [Sphingomonas sp. LH128]